MFKLISSAASLLAVFFLAIAPAAAQSRVALVIGNGAYTGAAALKTPTADADLMTTTLKAAGFDVTEANDLAAGAMGEQFTNFIAKVKAAGSSGVVFIYFSGYGAQYNGDSYLVPIDAQIKKADDVQNVALSLTDITKALADVPSAARIIVLDAARDAQFGNAGGTPVAPGLALVGVPAGFLLAYPAAPGADICSCAENDANSPYASSLATLLRQPGLDIGQIFDGVRLQINQASSGAQVPWMVSALSVSVKFFQATAEAPKTLLPACGVANIPVPPPVPPTITRASYKSFSADEAYRVAMERDSLEYYQWFVEDFPQYQFAGQIWHIINHRRESILWHRVLVVGTTAAYWNYVDQYPDGNYIHEARFWLHARDIPPPPRDYTPLPFDLPPGYADEATGLAYVVARGRTVRTSLFGNVQTVYVNEAPRWTPPRVTIIVHAPPPPPPRTLIDEKIVNIHRTIVQPVQPVSQYATAASGKETHEIEQWHERLKVQQETIGKQYHVPVVAPTSVTAARSTDDSASRSGAQSLKENQQARPTIGNIEPKEPVKPTIGNAAPNEPVKPVIGNAKPNEPVKPVIGNAKPNEPVKPTIGNAKPNEPVKPTIGNAAPNEPVKPVIGNSKPNEPAKPAIGNAKPNEPVKPVIGNAKPNEPVKPAIGNAKPNEPAKPVIGNAKPNEPVRPLPPRLEEHTVAKPAQPNPPRKEEHAVAKPVQPVPVRREQQMVQPAPPRQEEHGSTKPMQPQRNAEHPPVAAHPSGCQHVVDGQCVH